MYPHEDDSESLHMWKCEFGKKMMVVYMLNTFVSNNRGGLVLIQGRYSLLLIVPELQACKKNRFCSHPAKQLSQYSTVIMCNYQRVVTNLQLSQCNALLLHDIQRHTTFPSNIPSENHLHGCFQTRSILSAVFNTVT